MWGANGTCANFRFAGSPCCNASSRTASPQRFCPAQVDYLRNYEYLMDTTFKRAHPVKYTPGTTGDHTRISSSYMYFTPTQ